MKMENLEVQQGFKFGDRAPAALDKSMKLAPSRQQQ